uniref:Costars domain-containing protein n=2 Tax=Corethron hystrix TaxID=216773 RepID=A0A7S1FMX7_9STRA|mmetsp:Transcript_14853/g.32922  ORF Transcript_14853/g.32922 Transcript_14853/m.32922 type:complete len:154 (+) Transcript_14853:282-743(+)
MSDSHQQLVEKSEKEMIQLVKDIKRIGDGKSVKFGALFDDEEVQDFYEALIGTLKGARKKGYIDFPGHLLLKGQHDNVEIIIVENGKSLNLADTLPPPAPISPTHELAKSALAAASTKPQRSFLGVASTVLASSPKNSSPSTPVSKKKMPDLR